MVILQVLIVNSLRFKRNFCKHHDNSKRHRLELRWPIPNRCAGVQVSWRCIGARQHWHVAATRPDPDIDDLLIARQHLHGAVRAQPPQLCRLCGRCGASLLSSPCRRPHRGVCLVRRILIDARADGTPTPTPRFPASGTRIAATCSPNEPRGPRFGLG